MAISNSNQWTVRLRKIVTRIFGDRNFGCLPLEGDGKKTRSASTTIKEEEHGPIHRDQGEKKLP